jgi:hypothetical protein
MTDDAVKRTLEKLTAAENREKEQVRKDAQIENIKNTQNTKASLLWKALMRWTEKHCADTNSEKGTKILEFKEDGPNRFLVVLNKDPRKVILTVEFEPRNFEVSYIRDFGGLANIGDESLLGGKRMQYFHSKIDGEDFSFTHQGMNMTVDQLGETLIQFLLGALLV